MSDETSFRPVLPHSRTALQDSKSESISGNSGTIAQGGSAEVHDRTGLYIAILALALGGMALGFEISRAMSTADARGLQDQIVDAKITAAIAKSDAEANEAKVNARVAIKEVATLCASLKAAKVPNVNCD